MPLRMTGKRQTITLAVQPHHRRWMKAMWSRRNLSLNARAVFHARQLLHKSEYLQQVFTLSSPRAGKSKICAKWIPHVLKDDQVAMRLLSATTHRQRCRNEDSAFLDRILTVDGSWMQSFDPHLKIQNAEWRAQTSSRKTFARRSQGARRVIHVLFFSRTGLGLDRPVPIGRTVNGQY